MIAAPPRALEHVAPAVARPSLGAALQVVELRGLHEPVHRHDPRRVQALISREGRARSYVEARAACALGLERERPSHVPKARRPRRRERELRLGLGIEEPAEHERALSVDREHFEAVGAVGGRGQHLPDLDRLERRVELARRGLVRVVQRVERVEASSAAAHLHEPRPDVRGIGVDGDAVGERSGRVGQQLVAREGPLVLAAVRRAILAGQRGEERAADEVRARTDDEPVSLEASPRGLIGGVDAHLDLDATVLLAEREHAQRPRHLHPARFSERGVGRGPVDVHERDVELPHLADRADDHLARLVDQDLKAGVLGARGDRVEAELHPLDRAGPARRQGAQGEQRLHERRAREVFVAHEIPGALGCQRELDGGQLQLARGRQDKIQGAHVREHTPLKGRRTDRRSGHRGERLLGRVTAVAVARALAPP
jgi:hypothetical protein